MELNITNYKRCGLLNVSGRVDSNTAPEFEGALREILDSGRKNVVLELSEVDFMSSAGLRGMVSVSKACKKSGGTLALATPSERVKDVLQLAGLTSLFVVFDDVTAAVGAF